MTNVHGNNTVDTGMYQDLTWREINFAQNLISAVFECSENVAFNAQKLQFKIAFDEASTSDCAGLLCVVDPEHTGGEVIVVEIELFTVQ